MTCEIFFISSTSTTEEKTESNANHVPLQTDHLPVVMFQTIVKYRNDPLMYYEAPGESVEMHCVPSDRLSDY